MNDAKVTANTSNVTLAGALMDSELTNLAAVKAIDQSLVNGATPTFTTTNFTDATDKRLLTDAQEAKIDALNQALATTDSPTFDNLTITGNASIQGTLTTVNSNDVNIGDRIITLNTADGAGDAGVHVHDTTGAQTGSIMWDASGNYWKGGLKDAEKRIVTFTADDPTNNAFIHTNGSDEIVAIAAVAGGILQRNAANNAFTVSNTIDGGSY